MEKFSVFNVCKAELIAAGHHEAVRCIQSLEARISESTELVIPSMAPKKPPSFVACKLCRKCKVKCVISQPGTSQCDRCRQAGCECVFEKHKRGRKLTRGLDMPRAKGGNQDGESSAELPSPLCRNSSHSSADIMDVETPVSTVPSLPHIPNSETNNSDDDLDVVQPPITHSAAHPLPFISGSHRPFTIQSMLNPLSPSPDANDSAARSSFDPSDVADAARRSGGGLSSLVDPVLRGLISLEMAEHLYTFFFDKLNPIVMLFDPALHTFAYVRHRSSFLFAAILSSSAKFVAPALCKALFQLAMDYSLRAILYSGRSVETIQAWMILYFWKAPRDNRAWMYVGLACRMGVELGLDCTPIGGPPEVSELDQRERRNRQRTWMLAFMMDRAMASATGRDWMVRGRDAVVRNYRLFSDHPLRVPGDAVVGGFTELRLISSEAVDLLYPGVADASRRKEIDVTRELLRINYDLKLWLQYWKTETERFNQPPIYISLLRLFGLHVQLTLNSFAIPHANSIASPLRTLPGTETETPEKYCYDLAIQNLRQLRVIHDIDENILRYMQDSISIMVAYAACFLRKVINYSQFRSDEREYALLLLSETSQMFREVACGPLDTATLQAQFLQSLVEHSLYTSRRPIPHGQHRTNEDYARHNIQDGTAIVPYVLDPRGAAATEDIIDNTAAVSHPMTRTDTDIATGITQNNTGVDMSHLDGATWDEVMADWMANPDSNSLQYNDFVTNFASSSFVDVQQHHLAEFSNHFIFAPGH